MKKEKKDEKNVQAINTINKNTSGVTHEERMSWIQDGNGRNYTNLDGKIIYRDEMIAAFIPRPFPSFNHIEHIDGDMSNDKISNLRWTD